MDNPGKMIYYRIGEYARKMGVTPDFLKYYERLGILHAETMENGYRYYPFDQSSKILECMRLKNYGFSVRSIEAMFSDDLTAVQQKMDEQIQELEEKVAFEQRVIQEHRLFSRWLERLDGKTTDWDIGWEEERLFLPHSSRRTFLEDPRIYEILKDWIAQMPMVKSCMEIPAPGQGAEFSPEQSEFFWGMAVLRSDAQRAGLPVNEAVKRLPGRKCFRFSFNNPESEGFPLDAALRQMSALGLTPKGSCYITLYMSANIKNKVQRCGVISIPVN